MTRQISIPLVVVRTGLVNIALRAITLGGKFILLFVIAGKLSLSELGVYGLLTTTITFALYLVGMDFYTFNIRDMLAHDRNQWGRLIRDQFTFHLLVYLVALPALSILFLVDIIGWQYAIWFYVLLVLEHICQESYRVIEATGQSTLAVLFLFIRGGIWPYLCTALFLVNPQWASLKMVCMCWSLGNTFSILLAAYWLRDLGWRSGWKEPVDWKRIRKGVKMAIFLLMATLFLRAITLIDRYLLERFWDSGIVGIYTFFFSIASSVQDFVNVGVITAVYPRLIASYQHRDIPAFNHFYRSLARRVIVATLMVSLVSALIIPVILPILHKSEFITNLPVYLLLLVATDISLFGMIPFYNLYARKVDRALFWSAFLSLTICFLFDILLIPMFGPMGAAVGYIIAMLTLALSRYFLSKRITLDINPFDSSKTSGSIMIIGDNNDISG